MEYNFQGPRFPNKQLSSSHEVSRDNGGGACDARCVRVKGEGRLLKRRRQRDGKKRRRSTHGFSVINPVASDKRTDLQTGY